MGGSRTVYCTICGEFASEANGGIDHLEEESAYSWDIVDFIFPKRNLHDTRPDNEGIDTELRAAQIDMRLAEIQEAFDIVKAINSGNGSVLSQQNLRNADGIGGSSRGLVGVNWECWTGRVRTSQVTMVGHSFGAATTVEVLRHTDRFAWVGLGVSYDI